MEKEIKSMVDSNRDSGNYFYYREKTSEVARWE